MITIKGPSSTPIRPKLSTNINFDYPPLPVVGKSQKKVDTWPDYPDPPKGGRYKDPVKQAQYEIKILEYEIYDAKVELSAARNGDYIRNYPGEPDPNITVIKRSESKLKKYQQSLLEVKARLGRESLKAININSLPNYLPRPKSK